MNKELLKRAREVLIELQRVVHDDVDTRVSQSIEAAIAELDDCIRDVEGPVDVDKLLKLLDIVVKAIPWIARLLNLPHD